MNIRRISLSKDSCYCGIQDFYDMVAKHLGYDPENITYDCTKIDVSKPVRDQIFAYYKTHGQSQEAISQAWLCYGPKASIDYHECIAEVKSGFIREVTK